VVQGRIAVDQAVRILEGKPYLKHVGPKLFVIDSSNVNSFDRSLAIAPDSFKPTFTVQ
jgi:protein TorT